MTNVTPRFGWEGWRVTRQQMTRSSSHFKDWDRPFVSKCIRCPGPTVLLQQGHRMQG